MEHKWPAWLVGTQAVTLSPVAILKNFMSWGPVSTQSLTYFHHQTLGCPWGQCPMSSSSFQRDGISIQRPPWIWLRIALLFYPKKIIAYKNDWISMSLFCLHLINFKLSPLLTELVWFLMIRDSFAQLLKGKRRLHLGHGSRSVLTTST